jgi:hypothetical protein
MEDFFSFSEFEIVSRTSVNTIHASTIIYFKITRA